MICPSHLRFSILAAATLVFVAVQLPGQGTSAAFAPNQSSSGQQQSTQVHLRWGARPGVHRYRLQLAGDREFRDIILDRVVSGNEYEISDLIPGRYFWRVAALTAGAPDFSSAGAIEVGSATQGLDNRNEPPSPPRPVNPQPANPAGDNRVESGNGWRALIGEVSSPVLARLRSPRALDLVATGNGGVVYALDTATGIVLWTTRLGRQTTGSLAAPIAPFPIVSGAGLDNIVILSANMVFGLDGNSGRQLWRASLPAPASSGVALSDTRGSELFIIDNSLRRLFLVDASTGKLIGQIELRSRSFGAPVAFDHAGQRGAMIAFEDGRVELRDFTGKAIRSGDAGSLATTPPLFVDGTRGGLVLLGTRSGLTALDSGDFRALGRVALKNDAPRGTLSAADLDGDGVEEVVMRTEHGRIVAVKAVDGKILWESSTTSDAESVAFADVDGDSVLDVIASGGQGFALALSGRDGSVVWKEDGPLSLFANHAYSPAARALIAAPHGRGILLIGSDPSRIGLRAIEFPRATAKPVSH